MASLQKTLVFGLRVSLGMLDYTKRDPKEVAMMTSEGSLFSYVRELVLAGKNWPEIKPLLQSRFSECGNSTLAKHKLHQLKQGEMAIHEYNEEYTKLLEHAYSLQPTDSATITLISSYIQSITNPYVRNKLRTARVSTLKEIFTFALEERPKTENQGLGL